MYLYKNAKFIWIYIGNNKCYGTNQNDVLAMNVDFKIKWNLGSAIGLCSGAVGISSDEIDGNRQLDVSDEVGKEEESAGGDTDQHRRRRRWIEVVGDLRGELRDSLWYLMLGP